MNGHRLPPASLYASKLIDGQPKTNQLNQRINGLSSHQGTRGWRARGVRQGVRDVTGGAVPGGPGVVGPRCCRW